MFPVTCRGEASVLGSPGRLKVLGLLQLRWSRRPQSCWGMSKTLALDYGLGDCIFGDITPAEEAWEKLSG